MLRTRVGYNFCHPLSLPQLQEKDVETQSLTEKLKLSELSNKVRRISSARVQLTVANSAHYIQLTTGFSPTRLREIRDNARIKTKLQGQAVRPSSGTNSYQPIQHTSECHFQENDPLVSEISQVHTVEKIKNLQ